MEILVLGGTRFMGKHLVRALLLAGHRVTLATRGLAQDDFGDQVNRLVIDRYSKESLQATISDQFYDVVIDSLCYCSNDVKILLEPVHCRHYIQVSTASVYDHFHMDMKEEEFDATSKPLIYCHRQDFAYGEAKGFAECATIQDYPQLITTCVRFPFILGPDDYTQRFYFYVDHILHEKKMFVDNLDSQIAVIQSSEAGSFIASLVQNPYQGSLNAASIGTFTIRQLNETVKTLTGKSMILDQEGERAPYNGAPSFSLNIEKAKSTGFEFSNLDSWFRELIQHDIQLSLTRKNDD